MIERHEGPDSGSQQFVNQPAVEIEPRRVDFAGAVGEDARPAD
jgi:hypothetical protein